MPPRKGPKRNLEKATIASLEKALAEERLALGAITKVFLLESPDPARLLARLESMCRAAEQNPRSSPRLRRGLLSGVLLVKTAIERELGKPQSLLSPDVGHVPPGKVDKLVAPTEGDQQLGLAAQQGMFGDVQEAHDERVGTLDAVHRELVRLYQQFGAMTDAQLHTEYLRVRFRSDPAPPVQSKTAIRDRRQELATVGRLVLVSGTGADTVWDVVERDQLEAAS